MKKKIGTIILTVLLALAMCLTAVACKSEGGEVDIDLKEAKITEFVAAVAAIDDDVSPDSEDDIKDAEELYKKLIRDNAIKLRPEVKEAKETLNGYRKEYDFLVVVDGIGKISLSSGTAIKAANDKYKALKGAQKEKNNIAAAFAELEEKGAEYETLKAENLDVVKFIEMVGDIKKRADIKAAEAAHNALSADKQNISEVKAAKTRLAEKAAELEANMPPVPKIPSAEFVSKNVVINDHIVGEHEGFWAKADAMIAATFVDNALCETYFKLEYQFLDAEAGDAELFKITRSAKYCKAVPADSASLGEDDIVKAAKDWSPLKGKTSVKVKVKVRFVVDVPDNTPNDLKEKFEEYQKAGAWTTAVTGAAGGWDETHNAAVQEYDLTKEVNLIPGTATATASSETGTGKSGSAQFAIDGIGDTRWQSETKDPQWIMIDFGTALTFGKIKIKWENAAAKEYTVEISNDKTAWTVIKTVTDGAPGEERVIDSFDGQSGNVTARYLKINGTSRVNQGWAYSIFEIKVLE